MAEIKKIHVKKGDMVEVISGKGSIKDEKKGFAQRGKVLYTFPKEGRIIVDGVSMQTKHQKPQRAGQQGGIIHQEGRIDASKVMVVCKGCNKRTRVGKKFLDNGNRVRVCKKCGEVIDE